MRFGKAWTVARKDLQVVRRRQSLLYVLLGYPIAVGVGLPIVLRFAMNRGGGLAVPAVVNLLDSFSFFFLVGAATLPAALAAYSIVGEKVEKSLEPLLATPTTDSEILLGKILGAWLPPLLAIWGGTAVFMVASDAFTHAKLGYLYYPNWTIVVLMLALAPVACFLSVEMTVLVSARVNNPTSAQQFGAVMAVPVAALYVAGEVGLFPLDLPHLEEIAAVMLAIDVGLLFAVRAAFQREEILTRWK